MGLSKLHVKKPKHQKRMLKRSNKLYGAKPIDIIYQTASTSNNGDMINVAIPFDDELPGGGQFYCSECDRYFIAEKVLIGHVKTKAHKKRVKELREIPYSVKESERCAGLF